MSLSVLAITNVKTNSDTDLGDLLDRGLIKPEALNKTLEVTWLSTPESKTFEFNAGSYKFMGGWLEWLALTFYGTILSAIIGDWTDEDRGNKAFMELFMHNKTDGSFDTKTCIKLYNDFKEHAQKVEDQLGKINTEQAQAALLQYQEFTHAFKFGADHGIVIFN
jgi:hypothetical protein